MDVLISFLAQDYIKFGEAEGRRYVMVFNEK